MADKHVELWEDGIGIGRLTYNQDQDEVVLWVNEDDIYLDPAEVKELLETLQEIAEDYEDGTLAQKYGNTKNKTTLADGAFNVKGVCGNVYINDTELAEEEVENLLTVLLWHASAHTVGNAWKQALGGTHVESDVFETVKRLSLSGE